MLGRIVDHVAALTKRREIARRIVGWIVIEVGARDVDPRDPDDPGNVRPDNADAPPPSITPLAPIGIPPATIAEVEDARSGL